MTEWAYIKLGAVYGLEELEEIDSLPLTDSAKTELFQTVIAMKREAGIELGKTEKTVRDERRDE